jgi:hypothetical protein
MPEERLEVQVVIPESESQRRLIHRVIERVLVHGAEFERELSRKESGRSRYAFLTDFRSAEHVYYRWKLFSLLQGDSLHQWNTRPCKLVDDSRIYFIPPPVPFQESMSDMEDADRQSPSSAEQDDVRIDPVLDWDSEPEETAELEHHLQSKFRNLVRKSNLDRGSIAEAMVFAMDHAFAVDDIVDILIQSILSPDAPVFPAKMARLYIVNDIVHNTLQNQNSDGKRYRQLLEARLISVMVHLNDIFRSIDARLRAEQLKRTVMSVLESWETATAFPAVFIERLKITFLRQDESKMVAGGSTVSQTGLHPSLASSAVFGTDAVKELMTASSQAQTDSEKQELREIERKVNAYADELTRKSQNTFASFSERLKKPEIMQKAQAYREQLLHDLKSSKEQDQAPKEDVKKPAVMSKFKRIGG